MRLISALIAALALPIAAIALAAWPFYQASGSVPPALSGLTECARGVVGLAPACAAPPVFGWVAVAAFATAVVGLGLVLLFRISGLLLGGSRVALAYVFPPIAFVGVVLASLLATAQIGLVAAMAYLGMRLFLDSYSYLAVGVIAGIAGLTGLAALRDSFAMFRRKDAWVLGMRVDKYEQPRLALFIKSIADRIGARTPDNVVIGYDPGFFITGANVQTPFQKDPFKGETLYISAPMLRALSKSEFAAIIGHELGHFSGGDTAYSRRFAPIYAGLMSTASALAGTGARPSIWTLPARAILNDMLASFMRAERRISRERETRADQLGAAASSPEDLAYSLLKMSILDHVWNSELGELRARIERGRYTRNLSRNFVDRLKFDIDHERVGPWIALSLQEEAAHPTDTHPINRERILSVGLDPEAVVTEALFLARFRVADPVAHSVLNDLEAVEEALTHAYHGFVIHVGGAVAPEEQDFHEFFLRMLSEFLAAMVTADGVVDDREITEAEKQVREWVPDFDAAGFRERCRHPDELPDLSRMIEIANDVLKPVGAAKLIETLEKVAGADGETHPAEAALLARVKAELKGSDPDATPQEGAGSDSASGSV